MAVLIQQPNSSSNQDGQPPQSLHLLARIANNKGNDAAATTSVAGQNDENRCFSPGQVDDIKLIPKQFAKGEKILIGFSDCESMYSHSEALPSLVSDAAVAVRQRVQPEWHLICSACFWKPTGMTRPYSILLRDAKMASKLLENWLKCSNTMSLTVIITMPMMITMRQDISSDEKQHEQN